RQGKRNMQPFDEQLKQLTEVEKFYHVTGRFDYIVKVNLKNVEELRDLLVNKLTDIDIIDRAETLIILSSETERGVQL
ncbi:MAG: Lrp/AsnC ligand binding domain-containing protein, partial [Calditrichia bacterium]|nr:Lrp/AsnC ligand binding domain-containing protein [Calditrichia bacterium]